VRTVVNEDELEALLACFGFETIDLHGRSLFEQARLFSETEAVVGVKGAALTNIVFCPAHCSVMVLSPSDFPDPFFWDIAGQLNLNYAELFGPTTTNRSPGRNDFVVDLVAVARMLGVVFGCAGESADRFSNPATSDVNYLTVEHLTESATTTTC
jgi:capsular polysaccharide biosynthesis protein